MNEAELTKLEAELKRFTHELVDNGAVYALEAAGKTLQVVHGYRGLQGATNSASANLGQIAGYGLSSPQPPPSIDPPQDQERSE